MLRVGRLCILSEDERLRLVGNLTRAEAALTSIEEKQASIRTQQAAIIDRQGELLGEARRERELAHARALEYQGLFVEQQHEIDSLQRRLTSARHPSSGHPPEAV